MHTCIRIPANNNTYTIFFDAITNKEKWSPSQGHSGGYQVRLVLVSIEVVVLQARVLSVSMVDVVMISAYIVRYVLFEQLSCLHTWCSDNRSCLLKATISFCLLLSTKKCPLFRSRGYSCANRSTFLIQHMLCYHRRSHSLHLQVLLL